MVILTTQIDLVCALKSTDYVHELILWDLIDSSFLDYNIMNNITILRGLKFSLFDAGLFDVL